MTDMIYNLYNNQIFLTQKWSSGLSLSYMQFKARVSLITWA